MISHRAIEMFWRRGLCVVASLTLIFSGCTTGPIPTGSRMAVSSPVAQFYRNGPAQDATLQGEGLHSYPSNLGGPDFQLLRGAIVTIVRRGLGFSKVITDDGQVGYMANDQLRPAPAIARAAATELRPDRARHRIAGSFRPRAKRSNWI